MWSWRAVSRPRFVSDRDVNLYGKPVRIGAALRDRRRRMAVM